MKLLAAIDFCEHTDKILNRVKLLAAKMQAHVYLVHVAEPEPDFIGYDAGPDVVRDQVANEYHKEHKQLQSYAEQLREVGIDATALLVQGPTVETLLKLADKHGSELIITGSHGRGMVGNLLMGSVSSGLVRDAKCPVTIVTLNTP